MSSVFHLSRSRTMSEPLDASVETKASAEIDHWCRVPSARVAQIMSLLDDLFHI